jgi:hypothetical protein
MPTHHAADDMLRQGAEHEEIGPAREAPSMGGGCGTMNVGEFLSWWRELSAPGYRGWLIMELIDDRWTMGAGNVAFCCS